jgi:hypothetical protein
MAEISENIVVGIGRDAGIEPHAIPGQQVGNAGWMNTHL